MPRRIEDFRGLKQASRVRLLHAVQKIPGRKLDELAKSAGIHINTAREHLHVLEEEGFIVSRPLSTGVRGRPPVVFDPVQQSGVNPRADRRAQDAQSTGDLLRRLYPRNSDNGALGGAAQRQIDTLYTHLEDVGLEPVLDSDNLGVTVLPCTYHDLLDESGSMVCSMHARLIQDQLSQVPGPLLMQKLQPFVTPHECRITLCARGSTSSDEAGTTEQTTGKLAAQGHPAIERTSAEPHNTAKLHHADEQLTNGEEELRKSAALYDAATKTHKPGSSTGNCPTR